MNRFFDDIARRKTLERVLPAWLHNDFLGATVLDITNVSEYWKQSDTFPLGFKDFPNATPSFKAAFFEWKNYGEKEARRVGTLFLSYDRLKVSVDHWTPHGDFSPTPRFVSIYICFTENTEESIVTIPVIFRLLISDDGCVCIPAHAEHDHFHVIADKVSLWGINIEASCHANFKDYLPNDILEYGEKGAAPCLLAQSFLHCKNIQRIEHLPNKKTSAQYRHFNGRPLIRYSTLTIDPMKQILRTEGQSEVLGLKKALHICRGHFANYTEGKGLFGKYHGQFWVPQHVKGSASQGIIEKDYSIKAPHAS